MPEPRACKVPVGLAAALAAAGVSPVAVLAAAGLPSRLFELPGTRLPMADYFALWRAIRQISADPAIAPRLVRQVQPDLLEPLFLALLSAADLCDALQMIATYKRMLSPEDFVVRADEQSGELVVRYAWPAAAGEPPTVLVAAELAFLVEMFRRGTREPGAGPLRVEFQAGQLEALAAHEVFFDCPIHLGAADNALTFAAADARRRFITHNPQMLGALLPYLQTQLPPASPLARVRSVIADSLRGRRPTLDAIGRELAMSGRALQRLLQDHGSSFRQLLDDVRNEHAQAYLGNTAFSDGEVAFLLGFEDPNSFYRAFRSWNGVSPSEFRRRAVGSAAP